MKKLALACSIFLSSLASAEKLDVDVKVGIESYLIGNLELSRYLLENALATFKKADRRSEFNRSSVLTELQ